MALIPVLIKKVLISTDDTYAKALHTVFSPTIAQETLSLGETTNSIYLFYRFPIPQCGGFKQGFIEGMHVMKISKATFAKENLVKHAYNSSSIKDVSYAAWDFPRRASGSTYKLQPQICFMKAAFDGEKFQLYFITNNGNKDYTDFHYKIHDSSVYVDSSKQGNADFP